MREQQSVNIRQISQNRAEQIGYYRFLGNENVTVSELVHSVADQCQQQVEGLHVLSISDTSEINLQGHKGRLKPEGIGVVGNNRDVGFFIHPTLALNAETGFPLGISALHLWTREPGHKDKHQSSYQKLPIEEKESYKWLLSAEKSNQCLHAGRVRRVTHISDREGDMYEEWASEPDAHTHLLIRACKNRRLWGKSTSLYADLSAQPCAGTYYDTGSSRPTERTHRTGSILGSADCQSPHSTSRQSQCPGLSP